MNDRRIRFGRALVRGAALRDRAFGSGRSAAEARAGVWRIEPVEASDDELVGRAAGGDGIAFAQLVGRHRRRLLALVSRALAHRNGAAEDIVQEVFVRAWVNAPSWSRREDGRDETHRAGRSHGGSYAAWLSRVAVNLAIDGLRRRSHAALDEVAEPADPAPGVEEAMAARERNARLRAAVAALPERQRLAIGLTYDAELSNAEGAAAMGTTVGAFELLLVRARRTLRAALREDSGQPEP